MASKARELANLGNAYSDGALSNRNKILNGAMVIDQRNGGSSVTPNNSYTVDRWGSGNTQTGKFTAQQNAGSVTPPAGFVKYLGITSSSAYSVLTGDTFFIQQIIEGNNVSDLAWGTASAKTITISFWVRSSLTGTFGGALENADQNRTYVFSYTISSANTWEYKTITVVGDTGGTWTTTNAYGIGVRFGLGSGSTYTGTTGSWGAGNLVQPTGSVSVVGTSGATFYLTGVQLEVGDTSTPFEHRSIGQELQLCQRYYYKTQDGFYSMHFVRSYNNSNEYFGLFQLPVPMRADPSISFESNSIRLPNIADTTGTLSMYASGTHAQTLKCVPSSDYGAYTYTVMARNGLRADAEL